MFYEKIITNLSMMQVINIFLICSKPCMQMYVMSLSCYFVAEHPLYYKQKAWRLQVSLYVQP